MVWSLNRVVGPRRSRRDEYGACGGDLAQHGSGVGIGSIRVRRFARGWRPGNGCLGFTQFWGVGQVVSHNYLDETTVQRIVSMRLWAFVTP